MTKFLAPLCVCLATGLVAAGCGGGSNDNNSNAGGGGGATKSAKQKQPATAGGGKAVDVSLKNIQFNPKTISVAKGGSVKWTNNDSVGHDVTGSDFKSGNSGGLSPGQSYSHTFAKAGTFNYRCTIHPGMTGTVTVK